MMSFWHDTSDAHIPLYCALNKEQILHSDNTVMRPKAWYFHKDITSHTTNNTTMTPGDIIVTLCS